MNSLVKVFSNFREFYSEINGATLTGAIDVVVVEQSDGSFVCSPFHVRFGKLGVLRSREKVVDIEVNGEAVDIQMKLGESGEAFFVEEVEGDDLEQMPNNLATSPIPPEFENDEDKDEIPIMPRRNSIDIPKESDEPEKKYENQISDFKHRRHTDNTMHRRNLSAAKNEFTTQKIRQEWAEHEQEQLLNNSQSAANWSNISSEMAADSIQTMAVADNVTQTPEIVQQAIPDLSSKKNQIKMTQEKCDKTKNGVKKSIPKSSSAPTAVGQINENKEESKSKKKRRKKSILKRKSTSTQSMAQRKGSSSNNSVADVNLNADNDQALSKTSSTGLMTNSNNSSTPTEELTEMQPFSGERSFIVGKKINDFHFFSDTEVSKNQSPNDSRPPSPIKSDTEFEVTQWTEKSADDIMNSSASWKWGELPTPAPPMEEESNDSISDEVKNARRISMISNMFSFMKQSKKMRRMSQEGIYLSDLDADLDPEVEALYLPPNSQNRNHIDPEEHESGNGTSLPHSPSSIGSPKSVDSDYEEGKYDDHHSHSDKKRIALSLCGGLENGGPSDLEFDEHLVQYSEVCQDPKLFSSSSLVVRINGKYYNWAAACPIVLTSLVYRQPLPYDAIEKIVDSNKTSPTEEIPPSLNIKSESNNNRGGYSSWWYWRRSANKRSDIIDINNRTESLTEKTDEILIESPVGSPNITISSEKSVDESCDKYRKTLRLTSEQIESLNLKDGMNEVVFSVTTAYQGTSRCKCYLFRWKHDDKVVISDIDGTITKSDVLGHILPMVGRDWAQLGVAQLFSKIEENGYKLLYLSARAIGQSRATREYLRSICQGDVKLPDGPLLLNPTSLISAFHREVIEKKPEQFKIACLSDIQALFPQNPFYAGYGNRINDVWAYRAVGIPIMRIFTINPKGELKHELTQTFQSTYRSMTNIVDQLFPPINGLEWSIEFSNVNFWREPLPEMDENMLMQHDNDQPIGGTINNHS